MTTEHKPTSVLDEPVDISATIDTLCEQFGFDKTFVTWIGFESTTLTFEVLDSKSAPLSKTPHVFRVTT